MPPGVVGPLSFLGVPAISDGQVVFIGSSSNPGSVGSGVYVVGAGGGPLTLIADVGTTYPGSAGKFSDFVGASISNGVVAFQGRLTATAGDQANITAPASGAGPLNVVANGSMPDSGRDRQLLPDGHSVHFGHRGRVLVPRYPNAEGIFTNVGGTLHSLVNTSTAVPGGTGNFLSLDGSPSISGNTVAFVGTDAAFQARRFQLIGGHTGRPGEHDNRDPQRFGHLHELRRRLVVEWRSRVHRIRLERPERYLHQLRRHAPDGCRPQHICARPER